MVSVFSHPTLTVGSLVSFVWWQAADVATLLFSGGSGLVASVIDGFGARSLVDALVAAPQMAVFGVLVYSALCLLALRVLYRNLFAYRALRSPYGHAFFAS